MVAAGRFLGITVMPEYIQSEGVERVLGSLTRAGATAVTTSPYVMAPAGEAAGGAREPPIDAGAGGVRLLDRPLWGRRELLVRTAPSFAPERSLYAGLRYQPPMPPRRIRLFGDCQFQSDNWVRPSFGTSARAHVLVAALGLTFRTLPSINPT